MTMVTVIFSGAEVDLFVNSHTPVVSIILLMVFLFVM